MKDSRCTGRDLILAGTAVAALVFIDQLTKYLAKMNLADGPFVIWPGVFEFRYLENEGAAFSMLTGQKWLFIVLTFAFLVAAFVIYRRVPRTKRMRALRICIVFLTAGAVGNLIDRLFLSYVRDFMYFSLIDFPIFNVADICVSVTMCVLIVLILFRYRDHDFDFLKFGKKAAEEHRDDGDGNG
jgi:signal peptidase II